MIRKRLLAVALLGLTGCGVYFSEQMAGPRVYGAVRFDFQAVWERPGLVVLLPLDLPFSLAIDTICLPYTIYHSATYGERELDTIQGEASKPHGSVEGILVRVATAGFEVVPLTEWPPQGLDPIAGVHVQVYANPKEAPLPIGGTTRSDERGRYLLMGDWDPAWKHFRVEHEGYQPLDIPVSRLHDPTDQHYWADHRLLIRLARR